MNGLFEMTYRQLCEALTACKLSGAVKTGEAVERELNRRWDRWERECAA